jgi:gas vesicle protein
MADSDSELGSFIAGFLIGGLVGAAVALIMAPQSGEETREMLRERGIELKNRADETASGIRSKAGTYIDEGRERIEGVVESTRTRVSRRKPGAAEGEAPG